MFFTDLAVKLCRYSKFCEVKCNFFSIITNHIRIQELQYTFLCVVSLLVHHLIRQDSQTPIPLKGANRDVKQLRQIRTVAKSLPRFLETSVKHVKFGML